MSDATATTSERLSETLRANLSLGGFLVLGPDLGRLPVEVEADGCFLLVERTACALMIAVWR